MKKLILALFLTVFSVAVFGQTSTVPSSGYEKKNNKVFFCGEQIEQADFATFKLLGHGYAKDKNNVYYKGDVLKFVAPETFRLKGSKSQADNTDNSGYYKAEDAVYYNGKRMKDVFTVRDFKDHGDGYATDTFHAYYQGVRIQEAHANGFKNLGRGYAKDVFNTYYLGRKTE